MTCEAGHTGEGVPSGAPNPTSVTLAALRALGEFSKAERLAGSIIAHQSFDGILAEHALALEEARDMLREALAGVWVGNRETQKKVAQIARAGASLDDQIKYIHALGSVAEPQDMEGEP